MSEYYVQQKQSNGAGVASLVCGIVSFIGCCNPLYLVSLAAVVLGIVGLSQKNAPKGAATAGLILGFAGAAIWVVLDILLAIPTMGISFFV